MLISEKILDYPVISCKIEACIARIIAWVSDGWKAKTLVCANPHSLVGAAGDNMFRIALLDADMIVPDGAGIVLASRILGGGIRERITGSDVFRGVNEAMNRQGQGSCFFPRIVGRDSGFDQGKDGERFSECASCWNIFAAFQR